MFIFRQLTATVDPYAGEARPTPWRGWGLAAYACAAILAGACGYFLLRVPMQVSDNVWNLITVERLPASFLLTSGGLQRPFLWGTLELVTAFSGGNYFVTFKTLQILQVLALLVLVVRVLGVRTMRDAAVVPLCLKTLAGFHTFRNLVQEAYPINTYLSNLVYLAAAMNLLIAKPGWRTDLVAALLLIVAALTLETGLLVWVVLVVGYVVGFRGVSPRGLAVLTALTVAYVVIVVNTISGATTLTNAPTGFGFERLEPQQVTARFGANPLPFWAYNVASSVATVLFAEPRRGLFHFALAWSLDEVRPSHWLSVGLTTGTTLLILGFAAVRVRSWLQAPIRPRDRWLVVFAVVLLANAAMSFAYTKDDIMSPAGLIYAVALFGVITTLLAAASQSAIRSALLAVPLAVIACGWSLRVLDVPYAIVLTGLRNQTDWARIEAWKRQNDFDRVLEWAPLVERMESEALRLQIPNPHLRPRLRRWDRLYSGAGL